MGVVCNSEYPATVLRERFNRFGIGGFPAIVSSIDMRHIKPEAVV